jgi:hypothetical protein
MFEYVRKIGNEKLDKFKKAAVMRFEIFMAVR